MAGESEKGQALVTAVLMLGVLMGLAGMAIDLGVLRYEKRLQQTAADAAALAGASNLAFGGVTVGAQNASAADGFTDNGGGLVSSCGSGAAIGTVCVQVNNPPTSGPHNGDNKYVEALVAAVQPTYFMPVFGTTKVTVTARAVATNLPGGANSGCLYTLDPNTVGIEGININGSASLNAPNCGIVDNGNLSSSGNAYSVTAATFGVSGTQTGTNNITCTAEPTDCPSTGSPASGDPLSYLTAPSQPAPSPSCPGAGPCNVTTSGTQTLQPGTYNSITFGKNSTVTLSPGIYYIDGAAGVTFNGAATVNGNGVMFYFTCPSGQTSCSSGPTIDATGGGNNLDMQLSPPTSGPYAGVLFYQNPNDTTGPALGGDNNTSLQGALYFPKARLTFFGNNNFSAGIVVAGAVALSGSPTVNLQGSAGLPPGVNLIWNAILVE